MSQSRGLLSTTAALWYWHPSPFDGVPGRHKGHSKIPPQASSAPQYVASQQEYDTTSHTQRIHWEVFTRHLHFDSHFDTVTTRNTLPPLEHHHHHFHSRRGSHSVDYLTTTNTITTTTFTFSE